MQRQTLHTHILICRFSNFVLIEILRDNSKKKTELQQIIEVTAKTENATTSWHMGRVIPLFFDRNISIVSSNFVMNLKPNQHTPPSSFL